MNVDSWNTFMDNVLLFAYSPWNSQKVRVVNFKINRLFFSWLILCVKHFSLKIYYYFGTYNWKMLIVKFRASFKHEWFCKLLLDGYSEYIFYIARLQDVVIFHIFIVYICTEVNCVTVVNIRKCFFWLIRYKVKCI